jgi:DNA-binding response OmpR family regulator
MEIYLIEDDGIYAEFVTKALSKNPNHRVKVFDSAEAAEKAIGTSLPDVMIVDYNLPGISGIDFYERIKSKITDVHKVIMLSAIDDGQMVLSFIQ